MIKMSYILSKKIPAFVINLEKDVKRLETISVSLANEMMFEMVRIPAIAGNDLPHIIRSILAHNDGWASHKGEIGCFLSHIKAWETVAATTTPFSVILEDDAILCGMHRIISANLPEDFDLIFINDRMSVGLRTDASSIPLSFVPVKNNIYLLNERDGGVGGDGYVLTPSGAKKLLATVAKDLCFGHVDWRLLRYCVAPDHLLGALEDSFVASVLINHHNPHLPPAWDILRAYCTNTPLVHFGLLPSSRLNMNET